MDAETNLSSKETAVKWLLAVLLGSSTVATVVTKTWDYMAAALESPAELELIDVGAHSWNGQTRPHLLLRNVGDRVAVVTGLNIDKVYAGSFYTDRPLDRDRAPRIGSPNEIIFDLQIAAAVPPGEFISVLPVDPHPSRAEACVEYVTEGTRRTTCGNWNGDLPGSQK